MADNRDRDNDLDGPTSVVGALAGVPLEVVRLLKGDKILLSGMGAACLLTIIAIIGPEDTRFSVAIVAAFMLAIVAIRVGVAQFGRHDVGDGDTAGNAPTGDTGVNLAESRGSVDVEDSHLRARRKNHMKGTSVTIKGSVLDAGYPAPTERPAGDRPPGSGPR